MGGLVSCSPSSSIPSTSHIDAGVDSAPQAPAAPQSSSNPDAGVAPNPDCVVLSCLHESALDLQCVVFCKILRGTVPTATDYCSTCADPLVLLRCGYLCE